MFLLSCVWITSTIRNGNIAFNIYSKHSFFAHSTKAASHAENSENADMDADEMLQIIRSGKEAWRSSQILTVIQDIVVVATSKS